MYCAVRADARGNDSSARPILRRQAGSRGPQPRGGAFRLGAARRRKLVALCQRHIPKLTSELFVHHVIAEVGNVANHAGNAQAAFGHGAVLVKMTAMKVGVGDDGTARHFVEGYVLSGQVGCTGDHYGVAHPVRVLQRPAQRLHAAQRAAHYGRQLLDSESVQQAGLGINPVFHRHDGEICPINPTWDARVGMHGTG